MFNLHTFRSFDGSVIPISKEIHLLGVSLDPTLSMDRYVSDVISAVNLTLRNIKAIRKFLNKKAVETLVHSLITSKLDSCNVLFFGWQRRTCPSYSCCKTLLFGVCWIFHHIPLCLIITWSCTGFMWRNVFISNTSLWFSSVWTMLLLSNYPQRWSYAVPSICYWIQTILCLLQAGGKRSFSYLAPRLWNALPVEMRIITNIERFKSTLKQFLFTDFRAYLRELDPYTSTALMHGGEHADDDFLINYIFY